MLVASANILLAAAVFALVVAELVPLAITLVIVSKWQILTGGRKSWWLNIKSNACDLIVGVSLVILMSLPEDLYLQGGIALLYVLWLVFIKPRSSQGWMGVQAAICQFLGLNVIFLFGRFLPAAGVIGLTWLVTYIAAWHFLSAEENTGQSILTAMWALLAAELSWLLWHWLITYAFFGGQILIAQAALVVTVLGYCFGRIYLDHIHRRLHRRRLVEYVAICFAVLAIILIGTEWDVRL